MKEFIERDRGKRKDSSIACFVVVVLFVFSFVKSVCLQISQLKGDLAASPCLPSELLVEDEL